uniref:TIR domain-containing protein n=1 Tax=Steinernema glaseri TaxID=37863 RepID=A0A1I7ZZ96_9BILA
MDSTLVVLLLLVLLALFSAPVSGYSNQLFRSSCPKRCHCVPDIEANRLLISCRWQEIPSEAFASFPANITKSLSVECADSDAPSPLPNGALREFSSLAEIRIKNCRLEGGLAPRSLEGLSTLRALHLDSTRGIRFSEGAFRHVPKLEQLSVVDSQLDGFPEAALCDLRNLQILNVSHNLIDSANLGIASKCNLDVLLSADLSGNRVGAIEERDLWSFPSLRQLYLAGNAISRLDNHAFARSSQLQHLDLNDNRLAVVGRIPEGISNLNLANNQLTLISATVANLASLKKLNVSGNAIDLSTPFSLASSQLETLDLSANRFPSIPFNVFERSTGALKELNVAGNRIQALQPRAFRNFTRLQKLDISGNQLKNIADETFAGLEQLEELKVAGNEIVHVDIGVFNEIGRSLVVFDASKNALQEIPVAIGKLSRAKHLNFARNHITKAYKFVLSKMPHLRSVDLSENRLQRVDSFVFADCPHLETLVLRHNRIDEINADAFSKCPRLRHLDLSENFVSKFNGSLTELSELDLLNASSNAVEILEWREFPSTLRHLVLDHNLITLIGSAESSKVREVELQFNRIMSLAADQLPRSLETLNVSRNAISVLADHVFRFSSHLRALDLRFNQLKTLKESMFTVELEQTPQMALLVAENPLDCSCDLDWIKKPKSKARQLVRIVEPETTFCQLQLQSEQRVSLADVERKQLLCGYEQMCEPECICCQYGNCDCKSICPQGCSCFHDASFETNVVHCSALNGSAARSFTPRDLPMFATHVYLERLELPVIKSGDFFGRSRLLHLHINASNVETVEPKAFSGLPSLQLLDLSKNRISTLNGSELVKTAKIAYLFLNDNRLRAFEPELAASLPNLQVLSLNGNQLEDLPKPLVGMASGRLSSVSLGKNPFRCDCSDRFLMQSWLPENSERVVDVDAIFCVENVTRAFRENDTTTLTAFPPNQGPDIFTMPMLQFVVEGNRSFCVPQASGIFGQNPTENSLLMSSLVVVALLISLATVALVVALFRKTHAAYSQRRYKKATPSLNCSSTTPGCSPLPPLIHYDAFVAYSRKDEKMVIDKICRRLEEEEQMILCLLHRDAPSAYSSRFHSISDDLLRQVDQSQSLILVLTKHFLENEWITLQIKTSLQYFAKSKNKKLITVVCKDVDANQLDPDLGQILRKNDHIMITESIPLGSDIFWNRLKSALPMRDPATSDCSQSQIYSEMYGSIVPSDIV